MTDEQIRKKVLSYHWEPWLKRPFFGFLMSTFHQGNTKKAFAKIGLKGWFCDYLYSDCEWYQAEEVYQNTKTPILKWMKKHSVSELSEQLEKSQIKWKKEMVEYSKQPEKDTFKKLTRLSEILRENTTYIWSTHSIEHFFMPMLRQKVSKYIKTDVDKFIGDASFPEKHNSLEQMVEEYKKGTSAKLLTKKYGWMRARDGFARPYTEKEIVSIAKHALSQEKHTSPKIPAPLEKMFNDARELVYMRTLRTDIYFEIIFLARPLLKTVAKKLHVPFAKLKYCPLESLLAKKPTFQPEESSFFTYGDKIFFQDSPLFTNKINKEITSVTGATASAGITKGIVKIVMTVKDLPKVEKGDILVTYMTSPNFLPAMKLASGFVTDEGGLTCHAAIVAREMKKPCIIGTKIATKVFKDGDIVKVDANTGTIKKLN